MYYCIDTEKFALVSKSANINNAAAVAWLALPRNPYSFVSDDTLEGELRGWFTQDLIGLYENLTESLWNAPDGALVRVLVELLKAAPTTTNNTTVIETACKRAEKLDEETRPAVVLTGLRAKQVTDSEVVYITTPAPLDIPHDVPGYHKREPGREFIPEESELGMLERVLFKQLVAKGYESNQLTDWLGKWRTQILSKG